MYFATRQRLLQTLLALLPVLLLMLAVVLLASRKPATPEMQLERVTAIEAGFAAEGYPWPPQGAVPRRIAAHIPEGISQLEVRRRKALFFRILLPVVLAENRLIAAERARLQALFAEPQPWGEAERAEAAEIAGRYGVDADPGSALGRQLLLRRVDTVPPGLALAQAANESAWGSSRFAREGNNLFGMWTWDESRGMLPQARDEGANHLVRSFPDLRASVHAYLHNLNTGVAYRPLRLIRERMRAEGRPLAPLELAGGLERYSERGAAYVEDIRTIIRANGLDRLGTLQLAG